MRLAVHVLSTAFQGFVPSMSLLSTRRCDMQDFPQDVKARERGGVGKGVGSVTAAAGALSRHEILPQCNGAMHVEVD